MKSQLSLAAGILAAALVASPAQATLVYDIDEFSDYGAYGEVTFNFAMPSTDQFRVTVGIENTTSTGIGGALTSLAFDVPDNSSNWQIVNQGSYNFTLLHDTSLAPFGLFDACLATGQNCQGGTVSEGVAAGDSATIVLSATSSVYQSAAAFEAAMETVLNEHETALCAKFQGLRPGDKSDKVCGEPSEGGGGPGPGLPEPISAGLLGLGLTGLFLARRRQAA
ncbi:MAG: cistern family PEP-CTERM protein [Alphaproteobacteria bacterium]|nr:cistern family PEP-CTERM protein [Alphaproteobacteria bacterium]MBF0392953.1 cistern family PEP-CTERM protein [Alphaproteobacteria bacterium]